MERARPRFGEPTIPRHFDLPDGVVCLGEAQVAAGRAATIEEMVRVGVAALEREQRRYDAKMAELRAASFRTALESTTFRMARG